MNILFIRNAANKVNPQNYNLQEIGFCKALVEQGNNCDIIYSNGNEKSHKECIYKKSKFELNILWTRLNLKLLNNAIFVSLLNKNFYKKYDLIIITEYTQIMTFLLTRILPQKIILYQGPYKDNPRFIVQKIYDFLFLNSIRKKVKCVYVKSKLAYSYMKQKGFEDIHLLGVGLNAENFNNITEMNYSLDNQLVELNNRVGNNDVLLYIGVLEERRNIKFLFELFKYIQSKKKDTVLLVIGNGEKKLVEEYFQYAENLGIKSNILYYEKFSQDKLRYIYGLSKVFVLPTKYEIFGMVMLESMYFGIPIVTTLNGGSSMLIETGINGYIINNNNVIDWANVIINLLKSESLRQNISIKSKETILNSFTWQKISDEFLKNIKHG